ncbi:MAG: HTH domain-containing protein [Candidatus Nealsonbacteria bacterium]|nr:HTH domain-containing protein [Candidatus Nealsonbacteria bacterium]
MTDISFYSQKIYQNLLNELPERTRNVIGRRFGLGGEERETLDSIGKSYGVCRERVRQIEDSGINLVKKELKKPLYREVFQYFISNLKRTGNLKREDLLLSKMTPAEFQNQTLFWLTLGDPFFRFSENNDFHSLWTINLDSFDFAQKVTHNFIERFNKEERLIAQDEIFNIFKKDFGPKVKLTSEAVLSYLEISKKIDQDSEGLFGLKEWPEVSPRGVKDKAFLALKKANRPLHFNEVTNSINQLDLVSKNKALPQTVHNELIRDQRFVLVGRGIYALKEWGYLPGQVKDIIQGVLKENKDPLSKQEIIKKVLNQRLVKENTILLNLQNKKYFSRNDQGKYTLKV